MDFNDKEFNFEEIKDLPLLTIDNKLFEIAEDHCIYLSTNGTSGHIGKNNMKNESDNIKNENYTECIIYGLKNPILIVNFLIIDKYSKNKENRKNIFNPKFTRIGISILEHISYGYCCVIILG